MTTKSTGKYWSKNNPRPKPIGYKVSADRKVFPPYLFNRDAGNDPIPQAMEDYHDRNYHYPVGVTPIYENEAGRKEDEK
jgi:hypothetical protein